MAAPTSEFWSVPQATALSAINTEAERVALETGAPVSTGVGNEIDFAEVDISGGANDSGIRSMLFKFSTNGGNTNADTFLLWNSLEGFEIAASKVKYQPIICEGSPANNHELWEESAVIGDYTWYDMPTSEPGAINVRRAGDAASTSIDITTLGTTDDVVMWAMYCAIGAGETTGTYKGADPGYELQFSFKYSYS